MKRWKGKTIWLTYVGAPILVPLTTSLYVPGTLASKDTVIVDVGTGFYVEKVCSFTGWPRFWDRDDAGNS